MGEHQGKAPAEVQAKVQRPVQAEAPSSVLEEPNTGPNSGLVPDAQLPAPPEPQAAPVEPIAPVDPALTWWGGLTDVERRTWSDKADSISRMGGRMRIRTPEEVACAAYVLFQAKEEAAQAKQDVAKTKQRPSRAPTRRRAGVEPSS